MDARLIGDAGVWAAEHPTSWNEHYNLTNGGVFSWQDLWPSLAEFPGESHYSADARFGYGLKSPPAPAFVSTVKIKQAGFTQTYDTEACVKHWRGG